MDLSTQDPSTGIRIGLDDLVIVPLVISAFGLWRLLRRGFLLLVDLIDIAFPILLQVMRFPLFSVRILGDSLAAILKGVVRLLPIGGERRAAWREFVGRQWSWLRQKISYRAFEEALHHAFERGMAWVFRTCRTLSPRLALLVLIGAVLWLPVSFAVATGIHAVLFAKALNWPAWTQLFHPVATVIAKSKLLVLPVYPASWPQARQHPMMRALQRLWMWTVNHRLIRKAGYRFRQTEAVAADIGNALQQTAAATGLSRLGTTLLSAVNMTAARLGGAARSMATGLISAMSCFPVFDGVIQRYREHYERASQQPADKFSQRVRDFVDRWSVKFTAEYYDARDRRQADSGGRV